MGIVLGEPVLFGHVCAAVLSMSFSNLLTLERSLVNEVQFKDIFV